jgi:hypothetical protein
MGTLRRRRDRRDAVIVVSLSILATAALLTWDAFLLYLLLRA